MCHGPQKIDKGTKLIPTYTASCSFHTWKPCGELQVPADVWLPRHAPVSQKWFSVPPGPCVRARACLLSFKSGSVRAVLSEVPCFSPSHPFHPNLPY